MRNCNHDCFEERICRFVIFVTLCWEGVVRILTIRMACGRRGGGGGGHSLLQSMFDV